MTNKQFAKFCQHFIIPSEIVEYSQRICWLWTGTKDAKGYGVTYVTGKNQKAHRAMFEHCKGELIEGIVIHHTCNNKACVNPFHLEAMTESEHNAKSNTKLRCKRGHELTDGNVYTSTRRGRISRQCKQCTNLLRNETNAVKKLVSNLTDDDLDKLLRG